MSRIGNSLLADSADIPLEAEQEVQGPGHCGEISEAGAGDEKHRRHQQEGQEGVLFPRVKSRRDEAPQLGRENREAQHQGREQRHFDLREEGFEHVGVDQPPLPRLEQRLNQDREDVLGEGEANEKGHHQRREAPQEPPAKLDQMLEQRLLGIVDVLHGSGRFSGGSSSPG
jgi:hypothetical protein